MELFDRIKLWSEKMRGGVYSGLADECRAEFEEIHRGFSARIDPALPAHRFAPGLAENLMHYVAAMAERTLDHTESAALKALVEVFEKKAEFDLTILPYPERVKARNDRQLEICKELSKRKKQPLEEQSDKDYEMTVVMVTFNQLQMTKECLESVFEFTQDVSYDVILIDNGSADGSYEYFKNDGRINVIRLPYNMGCLLAMEVFYHSGLDRGKFWMYMNNDVIVTPRWASNMLACIKSDPAIGLVMPTTNRSAGYLMIDNLPFKLFDKESAKDFGGRYNRRCPLFWGDRSILYAFVGLNRPSARKAFGYYEDAYYYPFYYADGDIAHSMKLAGYRLILQGDTYVHHYDGGSSVWKNRRVMLDSGESDFFNKYGYFPTDVHHSLPIWATNEKTFPKRILFLSFARANPADELLHSHRVWENKHSAYFAADTHEKLKMENHTAEIRFERMESWYDLDSVFQEEEFDLIILPETILTMRQADRFLRAVKKRLACNGQFVSYWENPVNIQIMRYFMITRRNSMRDACRLIKKSYAPIEKLIQLASQAGLFIDAMHTDYNKEDFYIHGVDINDIAKMCGIAGDEATRFAYKLKTMGSLVSMRNWESSAYSG